VSFPTRLGLHRLRGLKSTRIFTRNVQSQAPTPTKSGVRTTTAIVSGTLLGISAYTLGALYPPDLALFLSPRTAPPPPSANSPEAIAYTNALESSIQSLPNLQALRSSSDAADWYETRPFVNYPEERRVNSLTAGALRGVGRLALPPLVRAKKDESEAFVFLHVGRGVCGHDGIIHGGLLATVFDESLARVALQNLPNKIGVTAKLSINYKAPTKADQFIVIHTKLISAEGRKSKVTGTISSLDGTLLAEADALFVEPRYAKLLNVKAINRALGEPGDAPVLVGSAAPVPVPVTPEGGKA